MKYLISIVVVVIITLIAVGNFFYLHTRLTAVSHENVVLKQQLINRKSAITNFAKEKRNYLKLHKIYQRYHRRFDFSKTKLQAKLRAVAHKGTSRNKKFCAKTRRTVFEKRVVLGVHEHSKKQCNAVLDKRAISRGARKCDLTVKKVRIVPGEKTTVNSVQFNVVAVGSYVDIVKYISILSNSFVLTKFDISYLHRAILRVNIDLLEVY